jgi:hypothetical protein
MTSTFETIGSRTERADTREDEYIGVDSSRGIDFETHLGIRLVDGLGE